MTTTRASLMEQFTDAVAEGDKDLSDRIAVQYRRLFRDAPLVVREVAPESTGWKRLERTKA